MADFQGYKDLSSKDLVRRDNLGDMCFEEIQTEVSDLKRLLDEMVEIHERSDLPRGLKQNLNNYIGKFNNFATKIIDYDLRKDGNHQQRNEIIREIKQYYDDIFSPKSDQANNFLSTYNAIKNFGYDELSRIQTDLTSFKSEANKALQEVLKTSESLKKEAAKVTVSDYAEIFGKQSKVHSKLTWWPPELGTSERFFILGVVALTLLILLLVFTSFFDPGSTNELNELIPLYLRKLIILSILIYVIRFSFKNYTIHKHLSTLNKHRQNTLDSFRLFLDSISRDDPSTKDLLMIEVARAIYEQGKTGFLNEKGGAESGNPSVLELTKLVTKSRDET